MRFIAAICFIGCFFIHGFSLTIDELKNLDSAKAVTMTLQELRDAKQIIKQEIDKEMITGTITTFGAPVNGAPTSSYTLKPEAAKSIAKLQAVQAIAQSRIDDLYFRSYNAFDHLGSFHEYQGTVTLIFGTAGMATTFIAPATAKSYAWGWWMLPSAAFSIVAIHLGITEISLGSDLKGYSARISIPVK